jgi:hypothetical protein
MSHATIAAKALAAMLNARGYKILVDKADDDLQSTWIDVGNLCIQVHPTNGYGLYLDGRTAFRSKPDEFYAYGQLDDLLERMFGLLEAKP